INADWKRPYQGRLVVADDLGLLMVDACLNRPVNGLQEIPTVISEMKAQEIVAEQPVQQLFLPGKDSKRLTIRPWNVPKLCDDEVRVTVFQIARQEGEVVVLDKHKRGTIVRFL